MDTGTYGYPKQGVKKIDPSYDVPEGVDIRGRYDEEFAKILTKDALKFVAELQREFRSHIRYALECRKEAKRRYNEGALPGFDPATRYIREGEWVCAPVPPAVADRKVEITGPVERKMVINALNSGAKVFMVSTNYQHIFMRISSVLRWGIHFTWNKMCRLIHYLLLDWISVESIFYSLKDNG
ncbi:hypothetical protein HN51_064886 [Arachis hypogaea]|nr:Malate synthase, glyoxysomal [Arachis hypogaea]